MHVTLVIAILSDFFKVCYKKSTVRKVISVFINAVLAEKVRVKSLFFNLIFYTNIEF